MIVNLKNTCTKIKKPIGFESPVLYKNKSF